MNIILEFDGAFTQTTLNGFFAENCDLASEEVEAIRIAIASGRCYVGGGGAAPIFTISSVH